MPVYMIGKSLKVLFDPSAWFGNASAMLLKGLLVAYNLVWFLVNGYNIYPLIKSTLSKDRKDNDEEEYEKYIQKMAELPKLSVLVPAYHEENVLERCINRLRNSNYPKDNLDLIILTEMDDKETSAIAQKCVKKYHAKHVYIKETGEPKGKPRALKQGLKHADGEIVGVIDAEDIIDPDLFRHVAFEIKEKGNDAIQGKLDMTNDDDGWKNMQFRAEYGYWYNHYLPCLAKSKLPIPLGGTTNFFKKKVLEEIDDWDAYNLTEDFELGLRLYNLTPKEETHLKEYSVAVFNSVTREESPLTWQGWIKQRTRWQRGKIQTLKKVMKNPNRGVGKTTNSLMACILPHIAVINITGIIVCLIAALSQATLPLPFAVLSYINITTIPYYCIRQGVGYLKATNNEEIKYRKTKAVIVAVTLPVYWGFQWAADLRALKQEYFDKRIFWEKTEHVGRAA